MQASPMNLRYGASRFTAGASDLRYKANRIKGHVADTRWVGEAGTAFRQVCGVFITDLNKAADLLERISNELNTLAWRMEQIENLRRQIMYIEQDLWNLPYDDHYRQERANLSHQLSRLRQQVESEEREADQHATSAFQQILGDLHSLHFFAQDKSWWDELVSGAKAVGGFVVGIGAAIVDAVEGVFDMLIHFPQVLEGIGMLITEPGNVFQAIWGQVEESWKRDVTNGDAYSGGKWWGQAVGNVLLAVVGTKGLDKAVKVIKAAREAEVAATLVKAEKVAKMEKAATVEEKLEGMLSAESKAEKMLHIVDPKYSTLIDEKVTILKREELPSWLKETYTDGQYRTVVTNENIVVYRTFGGKAQEGGAFATTVQAANRITSKIDSALLPEWKNSRQFEAVIEIPKGTVLNIGKVEKQSTLTGTIFIGGGDQILLPQNWPREWIKEIRRVPSR